MTKILVLIFSLGLVGSCLILPQPAQADGCTSLDQSFQTYGVQIPQVPKYCSVGPVIRKVMNIAFGLIGMVSVIFFMIGGFRYMTAGGNEEQAATGKKTALYAVVGLVVVILAIAIVNVVVNLVLYGKTF